jgi:chromosomal replication initiator protein
VNAVVELVREGGDMETPRRPSFAALVNCVAKRYGCEPSDICEGRTKQSGTPRTVAMYLAAELSGLTQPEIAKQMGGRHHSAVWQGVVKVQQRLEVDAGFAEQVRELGEELRP